MFAKAVGMMVASFPSVKLYPLYYRLCDNYKTKKLKEFKGNYKVEISLPESSKTDLKWWFEHIAQQKKIILEPPPSLTIETDASLFGWGACVKNEDKSTGGNWAKNEAKEHINYLELLATWLGIQCFASKLRNTHIKILSDNTTVVAYINNQGGTKSKCNSVARSLWKWCENTRSGLIYLILYYIITSLGRERIKGQNLVL